MPGQNHKGILVHPKQKKSTKTQKYVLRKTASISSPLYDTTSVYTGPVETYDNTNESYKERKKGRIRKRGKKAVFHLCECHDNGRNKSFEGKYRPKTWDSITQWYGDADTTEIWTGPEIQKGIFDKGKYKTRNSNKYVIDADENIPYSKNDKKYQRKSKFHKKRGHHYNIQQFHLNSNNTVPLDESVISLYRKKKRNLENAQKQQSLVRRKQKSKLASPENLPVISFNKKCPEGLCDTPEAIENNFICKCLNKKREPLTQECTDDTCNARKSLTINSVIKFKDNILCVCRKYSQKLLSMKSHNMDTVNKDKILTKVKLSKQQNQDTKSRLYPDTKHGIKINNISMKKEHESEQTGDPFFEVRVNPQDMCILNPTEIKGNIKKYGRTEKNEPSCICPSRGRLRSGEICKEGICKKAYKNKQINFHCWCDKKIAECGDATCDIKNVANKQKKLKHGNHVSLEGTKKPLLEVQLDMDKMCVVNPREIEDKIMNNITVDDICSSGVCRDAALKQKIPFVCKCISKKLHSEITECKEDTCVDKTKKRRSKFCLFCTRICSKSENWPYGNRYRDQKRVQRRSFYEIGSHKLCRGKLCTRSDNLYKSGEGFSPNYLNLKHLPTCNCQECKGRFKRKTKDIYDVSQINSPTVDLRKQVVKHNRNEIVNPLPRKEEHKYKVKHTRTSNEFIRESDIVKDVATMLKKAKKKEKMRMKTLAQKLRNKKAEDINFTKEYKKRAKLDSKAEKRARKERMRAIKNMQKKIKEEPLDKNFCTALVLGILKIGLKTMVFLLYLIYSIIRNPKKSYWYVRDRLKDPEGTYNKITKWFSDAIVMKKLEVSQTVRGSDTLTILADHFMDSSIYQSLADKGKTKKEQMAFEQRSKARKRRIRRREQQAIHSCRHTLLTTLRNTPCLWVYHICPNFYPQCLSLMAFMRSFSRIMIFLVAFACWTPCILSFELCRAFLCCFMCTG